MIEADDGSQIKPGTPAGHWLERLAEAERMDKFWHDKCDSLDALYSDLEKLADDVGDREFQMLWANIEVVKPATYSREPVPVASSRFNDRKPLPRRTADILERALISDFEADHLHDTLILARDDLIHNARGAVWMGMKDRDGMQMPCAYHVDRKDYRHGPARKWEEVPWIGRCSWNTPREFKKRFGRIPEGVTFQQQKIGGKFEGEKKARVWECWDKAERMVFWVSDGCPELLDKRKPWYNLAGFWPCPRPAYGTLKRSTLTPVPDSVYYMDQLAEINELTCKIAALNDGLQVRALYASGNAEMGDAIERAMNKADPRVWMEPVPNLGNLSIKDLVLFWPIETIVAAIQACVELRRVVIDDVYQLSGISDIMRGETDAEETLGAQQLKSQYGSNRIKQKQQEMVRLARDITRMKAEMLAENVPIAELLTMAQVDDLPSEQDLMGQIAPIVQQAEQAMMQALQAGQHEQGPQIQQAAQQQIDQIKQTVTVEKVEKLLKDQKVRPFVLDIETDSTIEPDEMVAKKQWVEFSGAMGPTLERAFQAMTMAGPQAGAVGKFFAEIIRQTANAFKSSRRMNETIDELAEQLAQFQPPPPDQGEPPEIQQAKVEAEKTKADAAKAKGAADVQVAQLKLQGEQAKAQTAQLDAEKTAAETDKLRAEIKEILFGMGIQAQEVQLDKAKLGLEAQGQQLDAAQAQQDGMRQDRQMQVDATLKARDGARADAESKHGMKMAEGEAKRADKEAKAAEAPKKKPRRTVTRVTKHDPRGRILEFEQEHHD